MVTKISLKKTVPIGIVLSIMGYVAVIGPDGLQKLLKLGDPLNSDDHLKTGPDGELAIGFIDGSSLELGSGADAILDSEVFDPTGLHNFTNIESALESMRQNILAGQDPSLVLQAAEAGYALSEGGSSTTSIDINSQADPLTLSVADGISPAAQAGDVSLEGTEGSAQTHGVPELVLPKISIASMTILEPEPGKQEEEGGDDSSHTAGGGHESGGDSGHESDHETEIGHDTDTGHDTDAGHDTETGHDTDAGHEGGSGGGYSAGHGGGYGYAGGSLATTAVFAVTLSAPSAHDVRVDFTTLDGTAISGGNGVDARDYGSTSGTLIIPAGQTTGTIEVTIFADHLVEGDEQFYVQLSNPVNALLGEGTGIGTILDSGHGEGDSGEGLFLVGTPGDDVLITRGGADTLDGLEGNDTLIAGGGPDVIHGGPGDDMIVGLGGPDQLYGDEGNDEIVGHGGPDLIDGGPGDDIIYAGGGPDTVTGGEGDDFINAEGGPDTVDAGPGNDIVYGGGGPDILAGGEGDDILYGEGGPDFLSGGSGNDSLYGGGGPDVLQGGEGADILRGGGAGDIFRYESMQDGIDRIVDFDQNDSIDISAILDMQDGDVISRYVQITQSEADQTSYELSVNPLGSEDPGDFQTLLVLENMQVAPDVDELVANGNLVIVE
ncbi:MAG: retention module-containing protein [Gammaproteobacteria bacterium]|nr:retention module-containing protein [Gammaproteobacteria bacterium]